MAILRSRKSRPVPDVWDGAHNPVTLHIFLTPVNAKHIRLLKTFRSPAKSVLVFFIATVVACLAACSDEEKLPETVTYTEHLAPVIFKNCTYCHRDGGNAHFALENYSQAKIYASGMAYMTKERRMPPWPADHHYTEFVGQRVLSEHEIALFQKWATDGAVEGPKNKMPAMPKFFTGSLVGEPDMRIPVKPSFLQAGSSDRFLLVKVPFELPNESYASVIEFMPGRNNVVHHVNGDMVRYEDGKKTNVFTGDLIADMVADTTIKLAYEKLGLPNDDGTYPVLQKSVVNYLPGVTAQKYPAGIGGYVLPKKGAFLLNDLHYGFTKKDVNDSSFINIFFVKTPPERPLQEFQLGTLGVAPVEPNLVIMPNTEKKVWSKYRVPNDISILTVNPHMHLLGKSFKAYAVRPDGDTVRLISIPRWDFNWQYFYTFKKMVKVPAGSIIVAEGIYDNTKNNINNPFNPPEIVTDQNGSMKATDEMFQFIVSYLSYKEGDENISLETK